MNLDETCWADPLTKKERRELAARLSRACGRFYLAGYQEKPRTRRRYALFDCSFEMAPLHLDVTERAS